MAADPQNLGDKLLDGWLTHTVNVLGAAEGQKKEVLQMLEDLEGTLAGQVQAAHAAGKPLQAQKLGALLQQTQDSIATTYATVAQHQSKSLEKIAALEATKAVNILNTTIGVKVATVGMSPAQLAAIAGTVMVDGRYPKEWWGKQSDDLKGKFAATIREGMLKGEGVEDMVRRVRGTKANGYADGIMAVSKSQATALVRTSVLTTANTARIEALKANPQVNKGIQWVSTLDGRTSATCRGLDGKEWTLPGLEPVGHNKAFPGPTAHWQCRSTQIGVVRSWDELAGPNAKPKLPGAGGDNLQELLAKKLAEKGMAPEQIAKVQADTKASMDGQVSSKLTYEDWLKTKPAAFQDQVLGPQRAQLWRAGQITMGEMTDQSSRPLTLAELHHLIATGQDFVPPKEGEGGLSLLERKILEETMAHGIQQKQALTTYLSENGEKITTAGALKPEEMTIISQWSGVTVLGHTLGAGEVWTPQELKAMAEIPGWRKAIIVGPTGKTLTLELKPGKTFGHPEADALIAKYQAQKNNTAIPQTQKKFAKAAAEEGSLKVTESGTHNVEPPAKTYNQTFPELIEKPAPFYDHEAEQAKLAATEAEAKAAAAAKAEAEAKAATKAKEEADKKAAAEAKAAAVAAAAEKAKQEAEAAAKVKAEQEAMAKAKAEAEAKAASEAAAKAAKEKAEQEAAAAKKAAEEHAAAEAKLHAEAQQKIGEILANPEGQTLKAKHIGKLMAANPDMKPADLLAAAHEAATVEQQGKSAAAALSGAKKKLLAGQEPTPAQQKVIDAMTPEQKAAWEQGIASSMNKAATAEAQKLEAELAKAASAAEAHHAAQLAAPVAIPAGPADAAPEAIYHTFKSGSLHTLEQTGTLPESGLFGLPPDAFVSTSGKATSPWKPNEYGDTVVALHLNPVPPDKIFTASHQTEAIEVLFGKAEREAFEAALEDDLTKAYLEADKKIAAALKEKGIWAIHYTDSEQYGDEWAVISADAIASAKLKDGKELKIGKPEPAPAVTKTEQAAAGIAAMKAKPSITKETVAHLDEADYTGIPGWKPSTGKKQSYGVVIFDDQGRVLLREPTNHFGGAVWTFAKGGGTKPGTTALAELGEETGHHGKLHDIIPGSFEGTTSKTNYFIGTSDSHDPALMDTETQSVKWVTYEEAKAHIAMSDPLVAERDLKVLEAAYKQATESDGSTFAALVESGKAKAPAPASSAYLQGEEAMAAIQTVNEASLAQLTKAQKSALANYSLSDYSVVNARLAGKSPQPLEESFAKKVNLMDKAFAEVAPFQHDVVTYRGTNDYLGGFAAMTEAQLKAALAKGQTDTPAYFFSTSMTDKTAKAFSSGVVYEIRVPAGAKAIFVDPISKNKGEHEMLLPRNTTYKLVGYEIDPVTGKKLIKLEIVKQIAPEPVHGMSNGVQPTTKGKALFGEGSAPAPAPAPAPKPVTAPAPTPAAKPVPTVDHLEGAKQAFHDKYLEEIDTGGWAQEPEVVATMTPEQKAAWDKLKPSEQHAIKTDAYDAAVATYDAKKDPSPAPADPMVAVKQKLEAYHVAALSSAPGSISFMDQLTEEEKAAWGSLPPGQMVEMSKAAKAKAKAEKKAAAPAPAPAPSLTPLEAAKAKVTSHIVSGSTGSYLPSFTSAEKKAWQELPFSQQQAVVSKAKEAAPKPVPAGVPKEVLQKHSVATALYKFYQHDPTGEGPLDPFLSSPEDKAFWNALPQHEKAQMWDHAFENWENGTPPQLPQAPAPAPVARDPGKKWAPVPQIPNPVPKFPADPSKLTVVKALGGSTGAQLVKDEEGNLWVRKTGANPAHVREEQAADNVYRALGANVPHGKIYETPAGPVKLAQFIEGGQTLADYLKKAPPAAAAAVKEKIRGHFAADALMGNWDVLGTSRDNILVDKEGNVWRIDNGGSLRFRATGPTKNPENWHEFANELWTMRGIYTTPTLEGLKANISGGFQKDFREFFGDVTIYDIAHQAEQWDTAAALQHAPPEVRDMLERRMAHIKAIGQTALDFEHDGWKASGVEKISLSQMELRQKGVVARMKPALKMKGQHAPNTMVDADGNDFDELRSKTGSAVAATQVHDPFAVAFYDVTKSINTWAKAPGSGVFAHNAKLQAIIDITPQVKKWAKSADPAQKAVGEYYTEKLKEIVAAQKEFKAAGNKQPFKGPGVDPIPKFDSTKGSQIYLQASNPRAAAPMKEATSITQDVSSYISSRGGNARAVAKWMSGQAGSSWSADARAMKWYLYTESGKAESEHYWRGGAQQQKDSFDAMAAKYGGEEALRATFAAWIAYTQEILQNTDLPNVDRQRRVVFLLRTEEDTVMKLHDIDPGVYGGEHQIGRGICESHGANAASGVMGYEVTAQAVPFGAITGLYITEQPGEAGKAGNGSSGFAGDHENEYTADTSNVPFIYAGSINSSGTNKTLSAAAPGWKEKLKPGFDLGPDATKWGVPLHHIRLAP